MLSSSYGIIMYCAINARVHWKNSVFGINATEKHFLKGKMELTGKLASNDTTNIGMLPSTSTYVSIKFGDQYLHILNNKEIFNGIKVSTRMKNRESLFKY